MRQNDHQPAARQSRDGTPELPRHPAYFLVEPELDGRDRRGRRRRRDHDAGAQPACPERIPDRNTPPHTMSECPPPSISNAGLVQVTKEPMKAAPAELAKFRITAKVAGDMVCRGAMDCNLDRSVNALLDDAETVA